MWNVMSSIKILTRKFPILQFWRLIYIFRWIKLGEISCGDIKYILDKGNCSDLGKEEKLKWRSCGDYPNGNRTMVSKHNVRETEPWYEEQKATIKGRLEPHFEHSIFGISFLILESFLELPSEVNQCCLAQGFSSGKPQLSFHEPRVSPNSAESGHPTSSRGVDRTRVVRWWDQEEILLLIVGPRA